MFLRLQQLAFLAVGLFSATSYVTAEASSLSSSAAGTAPWIGRNGLHVAPRSLQKRDLGYANGRGVCSRNGKGDPPTRRDLNILSKRQLEAFPDDKDGQDAFMTDHTAAATSVIVDPAEGAEADLNTAFYRELSRENVALEVSNLKGCGVVVVVSKKAVYFTHFWELESFPVELGTEDDPVDDFDGRVVKLLREGLNDDFKEGAPPQIQEALLAHADDFKGVDNAQAYLIMSKFTDDGDDPDKNGKVLYPTSRDKIFDQIKDITGLEAENITYETAGENDVDLSKVAEGRVLFEYDIEGGSGDPAFRVIVERKEYFTQLDIKQSDCVCDESTCNYGCCANASCDD